MSDTLVADLPHNKLIEVIKASSGQLNMMTLSYRRDSAMACARGQRGRDFKMKDAQVLITTRPIKDGETSSFHHVLLYLHVGCMLTFRRGRWC